ncbi:hypothetical protein BKA93DRAFT_815975 [Sparassis latifolia]
MLLTSLPADVLLHICGELFVSDILSLRQTCKLLESIGHERSVWNDALRIHVLCPGFPVPGLHGRPLASLSASELEGLTLRALRFRCNWTSPAPVCSRRVDIFPPTLSLSRARNLLVQFLPGRENRWLLTITLYDQQSAPRRYILQCWDVSVKEPVCVAVMTYWNLVGISVNSDPTNPAVIALSWRGPSKVINTSLYRINFTLDDPESSFIWIRQFPSNRYSIALDDSRLIVSDEDNNVRIINADTGHVQCELLVPLLFDDPTLRNEEHRCLAALIFEQYVLTFCKLWIHLYRIPSKDPSLVELSASDMKPPIPRLDPIAKYKWQWRIDSLVISPHRSHLNQRSAGSDFAPTFPPINILIRFDTWFPWPVNILHHFFLPSNPAFVPAETYASTDVSQLPYLFSSSPTDGPSMANSIPSPVRLFTPSDMVLGQYGTALWIDAQTDPNAPAQAGDHGQRIVGKMLSCPRSKPEHASEGADVDRVSPGFVESRYALDASRLAAAAADAQSPMMVFNLREQDEGWNRVALDEEEGRIAVGSVDGKVTLFEYIPE